MHELDLIAKSYIVDYYNLDVVLAVGYRVKSQNGLKLKEWLENYISDKNQDIIV